MPRVFAVVAVSVLVSFSYASGQSQSVISDFDFIIAKHFGRAVAEESRVLADEKSTSELNLFAIGMIRFYQVFISTQDVPSCRFKPSCSNFTTEAIREGGVVKGILLGTDRLMRCHWFSEPQYRARCNHHREIGRICDPVELYLRND